MSTRTYETVELLGALNRASLERVFLPIRFATDSGEYRSSYWFDRYLIKAILGDSAPLERLCEANELKHAKGALLGHTITCLDAWAFARANRFGGMDLALLQCLGNLGLLRHAYEPGTGQTLANTLVHYHPRPETWKVLQDGGVNLTQFDSRGNSPLCRASAYPNYETMCALIDLGSDAKTVGWDQNRVSEVKAQLAREAAAVRDGGEPDYL
jgi:hypothetical protein